MGESALKSLMKVKKHIDHTSSDNCQSLNTHFQKTKKNEEPTTRQVITKWSLVTNKNQAAIGNMFTKENVTRSEIWWALKTVELKFSLRSCEGASALFREMCPDSKIADNFSLSKTKCNYILNFGLAPFFKIILLIEIKKSSYFTTIFDESLNKKFQRGQMGILTRFCDEDNKKVDIRYFFSSFLVGATATDIQETFMSGIKELDKNNFLQISSDGPNVNLEFLELMAENRENEELSPLIDIGTCGLHTVLNSLKKQESNRLTRL